LTRGPIPPAAPRSGQRETGMPPSLPALGELRTAARDAWSERRLQRFRVHDGGWANLVLEADGRVIFRFPRRREVADGLGFEVRALELLSRHLSIPTPKPVLISVLRSPAGWPFIAYPKLPGAPLSTVGPLSSGGARRLDGFIETLLRELAAIPSRSLLRIGASPGNPRSWASRFRRLETRFGRNGASMTPPVLRRAVAAEFERFRSVLRGARYRAVATHRDLGPDHILWDPVTDRPTGVIDWEDLCLGDPAFDLTGLPQLGRSRLTEWARERRATTDSTFDQRLEFYCRIVPIHGIIHAAETGDLRWLHVFLPQLKTNLLG
jgi:aminoglycoside 2''-phosphotransferase